MWITEHPEIAGLAARRVTDALPWRLAEQMGLDEFQGEWSREIAACRVSDWQVFLSIVLPHDPETAAALGPLEYRTDLEAMLTADEKTRVDWNLSALTVEELAPDLLVIEVAFWLDELVWDYKQALIEDYAALFPDLTPSLNRFIRLDSGFSDSERAQRELNANLFSAVGVVIGRSLLEEDLRDLEAINLFLEGESDRLEETRTISAVEKLVYLSSLSMEAGSLVLELPLSLQKSLEDEEMEEITDELDLALSMAPDDSFLLLKKATLQENSMLLSEAMESVDRALKDDSLLRRDLALGLKGFCLLQMGDDESRGQGEALMREALALNANAPDVLVLQGRVMLNEGLWEKAAAILVRAAELNENADGVLVLLAKALLNLDEPEQAYETIKRELSLRPDNEAALLLGAELANDLGDDEAAEEYGQRLDGEAMGEMFSELEALMQKAEEGGLRMAMGEEPWEILGVDEDDDEEESELDLQTLAERFRIEAEALSSSGNDDVTEETDREETNKGSINPSDFLDGLLVDGPTSVSYEGGTYRATHIFEAPPQVGESLLKLNSSSGLTRFVADREGGDEMVVALRIFPRPTMNPERVTSLLAEAGYDGGLLLPPSEGESPSRIWDRLHRIALIVLLRSAEEEALGGDPALFRHFSEAAGGSWPSAPEESALLELFNGLFQHLPPDSRYALGGE